MSSCNDASPHEQLCYIPCNFCNIILAVSVPCSSLFDIVTVRCGHCTNLWSMNMAAVLQSLSLQDLQVQSFIPQVCKMEMGSSSSAKTSNSSMPVSTTITAIDTNPQYVVNRRPEKKQRVPSAYNQFIKEEIQRIKANNPDISHREAFSTAAKNWAHFPHIHFGLMLETKYQAKCGEGPEKCLITNAAFNN